MARSINDLLPKRVMALAMVVAMFHATGAHGGKLTRPVGVMTATCRDARDAFCECHADIEKANPILCKNILKQCHDSFCSPLCLSMAWEPKIRVRCDRAPTWKGCRTFASQLGKKEQRAITAQFQAHVCSEDLKCCGNATRLLDWVENHVYGDLYPGSHLPLDACTQGAKSTSQNICKQCRAVVDVDIHVDERRCLPSNRKAADVSPLSLHERCLFLSDVISERADALREELKDAVCSCAGCCEGGCYYKEHESDNWMDSIMDDIEASFDFDVKREDTEHLD